MRCSKRSLAGGGCDDLYDLCMSEDKQLFELGVLEALRAFRSGSVTPAEYVTALHRRALLLEALVRAFAHLPLKIELPNFNDAGPLAGIPVGIKDIIDTSDLPTAYGSPIFENHIPERDAWVVTKLRSAGACIFGKTVTTEFAWRKAGPTANPWRLTRTPGGSSSGSAAAVAAGFVPLALGTQTLGSVIRPAAFCGVVGFKPSFGAIPRVGVHPLAASLDHVGLFARHVDDVALALSILRESDPRDAHGVPLGPFSVDSDSGLTPQTAPRLLIAQTPLWQTAQPAQREALEATVSRLRSAGGVIGRFDWPEPFARVWDLGETIFRYEAAQVHSELVERYPAETSAQLQAVVSAGKQIDASQYAEACADQKRLRTTFSEMLGGVDAILTLPAVGEAPSGLDHTGDYSFCAPWTVLGVPAMTLPVAFGPAGLPLGVQIVGAYRDDLKIARTAKWCEQVIARAPVWPRSLG